MATDPRIQQACAHLAADGITVTVVEDAGHLCVRVVHSNQSVPYTWAAVRSAFHPVNPDVRVDQGGVW